MVATKFKQIYNIKVAGTEYEGLGLGDVCGIGEKDYAIIPYGGKVSLIRLRESEGKLEGTFADWNIFSNSKEESCKDFCEHLLRQNGLLSKEAA